jgi:DNA-binding NtrC family response regulator
MFDLRRYLRKASSPVAGTSSPNTSRDTVRLLAIMQNPRDGDALRDIAGRFGWSISVVDSSSQAMPLLEGQSTPLVICDGDLENEDWREVFGRIAALPQAVCVLLASRVIDDYLWQQVIRNHGYDVVAKPFQPELLRQTVTFAWSWRGASHRPGAAPKRSA